jgi:hypothetical protein
MYVCTEFEPTDYNVHQFAELEHLYTFELQYIVHQELVNLSSEIANALN